MKKWLITILLIVSIGFGFFKQIRTAYKSIEAMKTAHREPGHEARILRDKFYERTRSRGAEYKARFAYVSDRKDGQGKRPAVEYYYDAQYGFLPEILVDQDTKTDLYLLDFETRSDAESFCRQRQYRVIFSSGNLMMAENSLAANSKTDPAP